MYTSTRSPTPLLWTSLALALLLPALAWIGYTDLSWGLFSYSPLLLVPHHILLLVYLSAAGPLTRMGTHVLLVAYTAGAVFAAPRAALVLARGRPARVPLVGAPRGARGAAGGAGCCGGGRARRARVARARRRGRDRAACGRAGAAGVVRVRKHQRCAGACGRARSAVDGADCVCCSCRRQHSRRTYGPRRGAADGPPSRTVKWSFVSFSSPASGCASALRVCSMFGLYYIVHCMRFSTLTR
jgi:hypothetical protein